MTIDQLVKRMPLCLVGGYDTLGHNTAAKLAWYARIAIDLYDEGQESDIKNKRQRQAAVNFMRLCGREAIQ